MGEEQENIYWKYLRDEYGLEIYRREVRMLLLEEERNQKLNVSDSCFEEVQFTIVISLARMKYGHLVDRMDKEQPFTGMYRCLRWRNDYGPGCMQFFIFHIQNRKNCFLHMHCMNAVFIRMEPQTGLAICRCMWL